MEDQRNWSDASYKTYVRPLARPWPYTLPKGEKVPQAVRLDVTGNAAGGRRPETASRPVRVTLGKESGRLPAIGLGVPAEEAAAALDQRRAGEGARAEMARLPGRPPPGSRPEGARSLSPARRGDRRRHRARDRHHRRHGPGGGADAARRSGGRRRAEAGGDRGLPGAGPEIGAARLALAEDAELRGDLRRRAPRLSRASKLGGGMATYFTELNRKRPPAALLDYVTNTTCPERPRRRRPLGHGDDGGASLPDPVDALLHGRPRPTGSARASSPAARTPTARRPRRTPTMAASASAASIRASAASSTPPGRSPMSPAFARGGVEAIALGAPTGPFGYIHRRTEFAQPYFDERDRTGGLPGLPRPRRPRAAFRASRCSQPRSRARAPSKRSPSAATAARSLWVANLTRGETVVELPGGGRRPRRRHRRGRLRAADHGAGLSRHGAPRLRRRPAHPRRLRRGPHRVSGTVRAMMRLETPCISLAPLQRAPPVLRRSSPMLVILPLDGGRDLRSGVRRLQIGDARKRSSGASRRMPWSESVSLRSNGVADS